MKKLNNRELFNLDQELFNFRGIDRAIWTRKAELMAKNGDDLVGVVSLASASPQKTQ